MPCKDLQTKIALRDALTADERRHAESCPECTAFATFDADLGERLTHWRDPKRDPQPRPVPVRRFRLAYAGAGLAAALVLVAVALPTRVSAKEAYLRMLGQAGQVRSVHLVVRWRNGSAPLRQTYELWWRSGAWREKWEGLRPSLKLSGTEGITFYRFDPRTGKVQAAHESAEQSDFRSFDLAKFATQYMDTPTRFAKPSPTRVVATNAGGWSRMIFTIDPATGLPTHAEKQALKGATWQESGEIDLEFDRPIPEDRFAPESLMETVQP